MPAFRATIALLDINPYVALPRPHLKRLLLAAGKDTGPIPVSVQLGGVTFRQNVVKYRGAWRLYLNGPMRKAAGKDVGARVLVAVDYDPVPRREPMPPLLRRALTRAPSARAAFHGLAPSRQKEILRYLNSAKTAATLERNIAKVVAHLLGDGPPGLVVLAPRRRVGKKVRGRSGGTSRT